MGLWRFDALIEKTKVKDESKRGVMAVATAAEVGAGLVGDAGELGVEALADSRDVAPQIRGPGGDAIQDLGAVHPS